MHDVVNLVLDLLIVAAFWWAAPRNGEHVRAVTTLGPDRSGEQAVREG